MSRPGSRTVMGESRGVVGASPRSPSAPGRRPGRPTAACALFAAVALAAGCAVIPLAGPVMEGDGDVGQPGVPLPQGQAPVRDAPPVDIVRGFFQAMPAGLQDGFATAREYLTSHANQVWQPGASVTVYQGEPTFDEQPGQPGSHQVDLDTQVAAEVDEHGLFTEAGPADVREVRFSLVQDAEDQWRIDELPAGILLNSADFDNLYRPTSLYFPTPDLEVLVPDQRWFPAFPGRNTWTYAAQALVESGPAPWLRDAVVTFVPPGTELVGDTVTVDADGTAVVELSAEVLAETGARQAVLLRQLEATLTPLPGVRRVQVQVSGIGLEATPDAGLEPLGTLTGDILALTDDDQVAVVAARVVTPLGGLPDLTGLEPSWVAQGPRAADAMAGSPIAVLSQGSRLLLVSEPPPVEDDDGTGDDTGEDGGSDDGAGAEGETGGDAGDEGSNDEPGGDEPVDEPPAGPVVLIEGMSLLAPSVDRFGWIWTGERQSAGRLLAARDDGTVVEVDASRFDGRRVESVRVARDGARIAIVSTTDDGLSIEVAGILRDADGLPQLIGESHQVGAVVAQAKQVVWLDEVTLGVLGTQSLGQPDAVQIVPVAGFTQAPYPPPPGEFAIVSITGREWRSPYVATEDGSLLVRSSVRWNTVTTEDTLIRYPAFPG